jgi:predicted MFS family arabinose efflux permease
MLDLSLFRIPAFTGAQVAAFAVSAAVFSLFLYLTLYLQNVERYDALQAGLRLLPISMASFVVAPIAGRASERVPARALIGGGLLMCSAGLALYTLLDAGSGWTALLPGLIVSGVGIGLVNPPLASVAIGVAPQERSGMASGVNNTFRQVGIATGIALLGTLFANQVQSHVRDGLSGTPLASHADQVSAALQNGQSSRLLHQLPPHRAQLVAHVARASFTSGLDHILLVGAIISLVSGVLAFALIRNKDLVQQYG